MFTNKGFASNFPDKDLEASKGEGKIGIEGLVVDDFRKSSNRIMDIQLDIAKLSASPEEESNNLSSLDLLREESAFHEARINSILNGELAEKYYNEALFYLSKDISKDWLIIDKETFTYNKYGKDAFIFEIIEVVDYKNGGKFK